MSETQTAPHPFKVEEGHVIEWVFNDGVEDYYQLKDTFNTYSQRAFSAFGVYQEWAQRTTAEVLIQFIDKMKEIINKQEIRLMELADVINKLEERTKWPIPTEDIILKMATITYFDRNESPYVYDDAYGREKIKRWKLKKKISPFSLFNHLKELIPSPNISEQDFWLCQMVMEEMEKLYELKNTLQTESSEK